MPETKKNRLIMRYQLEAYMECGTGEDKALKLIGEGFTNLGKSLNPKEYNRKYVNSKTDSTDVVGYAPSIAYTADCISDDPVVQEVAKVHDNELLGDDTIKQIVFVNTWESDASGCHPAQARKYAIVPDGSADGTEVLQYTGNFKAHSDLVPGTFDPKTKKFTEATASE